MPDTFYNPEPTVSQTNDRWSQPQATGDRWVWVRAQTAPDISWHIQHAFEEFTAWYIKNSSDPDIAWHIQNDFEEEIAWHIQHSFARDTAWQIFDSIIRYIAIFRLNPLDSTFKLNTLTSSFDIEKLQAAYTMLDDLITSFAPANPIKASFDIDPQIHQTFEVDSDLPEAKSIQKNESGTLSPYE